MADDKVASSSTRERAGPGPDAREPLLDEDFIARLERLPEQLERAAGDVADAYGLARDWPDRHIDDLRALAPSDAILIDAAKWCLTHDASSGFRTLLLAVLNDLSLEDADGCIG